jgi:hypothetical protein
MEREVGVFGSMFYGGEIIHLRGENMCLDLVRKRIFFLFFIIVLCC